LNEVIRLRQQDQNERDERDTPFVDGPQGRAFSNRRPLVVHRLEVLIDTLDALDERAKPIARNPIWSTHGLLLLASKRPSEKSRPALNPI
jgi:hypothetical protein